MGKLEGDFFLLAHPPARSPVEGLPLTEILLQIKPVW